MSIQLTLHLWMLVPALLVTAGVVLFIVSAARNETGGYLSIDPIGCVFDVAGLACLAGAGLFMLGRWLT